MLLVSPQFLLASADQIEQADKVFAGADIPIDDGCLTLLEGEPKSGKLTDRFEVRTPKLGDKVDLGETIFWTP